MKRLLKTVLIILLVYLFLKVFSLAFFPYTKWLPSVTTYRVIENIETGCFNICKGSESILSGNLYLCIGKHANNCSKGAFDFFFWEQVRIVFILTSNPSPRLRNCMLMFYTHILLSNKSHKFYFYSAKD